MRYLPHFLVILLGLFSISSSAWAGDDLFTISHISVSATGNNATEAREAAISSAEQQAFTHLLEQIAPSASSTSFSPEVITSFVSGMEVHNEKITPGYYSALIDISFSPNLVNDALSKTGIRTVEPSISLNPLPKKPLTILILPVLVNDQESPRIIPSDTWYQTWQSQATHSTALEYVLANPADLSPALGLYLASPSSSGPENQNEFLQEIEALKKRYRASLCAIATAYTTHTLGSVETVSYVIYSADPSLTPHLFPSDNDTITGLEHDYHAMAASIETYLVNESKKETLITPSTLRITVPVSSLKEWISLQDKLRTIEGINAIMPERITTRQVTAQMTISIPQDVLLDRLESISLKLTTTQNGFTLSPLSALEPSH